MTNLLTEIGQSLCRIGVRVARFFQRHYFWFGSAAILAIGFFLVVLIRHNTTPNRVVLLTGPAGGGGERLGRKLVERIVLPDMWDLTQRRFQLAVEPTDGYEDNRRRVDRDTHGRLIGFAHDGFNPSENVQILLPLSESYVHILVSKSCYDAGTRLSDEFKAEADKGIRQFRHLVPLLKSAKPDSAEPGVPDTKFSMLHKAFLGPNLSGTRQTAELILEHYDVPITPIDSEFEYDWEEMFSALVEGRIHLAFITTEPGVRVVQKLAKRGSFHLLGLHDADGIRQTHPHLLSRTFNLNSYGNHDFCSSELKAIATRRVLVCSRELSPENGYWLSKQLADAIREEVPTISWKQAQTERDGDKDFAYPLHASANFLANEKTPLYAYVPAPFWPLVITAAVGILAFSLRIISGKSSVQPAESGGEEAPQLKSADSYRKSGANNASESASRLQQEVVNAVETLAKMRVPLQTREVRRWQGVIRKFRLQLAELMREGGITQDAKDVILKGIGELTVELDMAKPPVSQTQ